MCKRKDATDLYYGQNIATCSRRMSIYLYRVYI